MTVTREELQISVDLLSKKIDDNNTKVLDKWDKLADSIGGMNTSIGRFLEKFDHQEEANTRISKDIAKIEDRQSKMSSDIVVLQTNQANSKNFWDKFGAPILLAAFTALSAINYFKG
tara:strand:- start:23 stop:373 length:351 start_codon:yes stop_codon:yes gene_type:complete